VPITLLALEEDTVRGMGLGLLTQGTVPATGGTTTYLIDANRQEPDGEYDRVDAFIKFTNGLGVASVNNGLVRPITGFSTGNQSITFAPALVASVPSGTTYDIFKNYGPNDDVRLAINSGIRDIWGTRNVYTIATTHEPAGLTTHILSVPSAAANAITQLVKVERPVGSINTDYDWRELRLGQDYNVVDDAGAISITLNYVTVASTVLRLTGVRPAAELTNDTDITQEPAHLIVLAARKFLALQDPSAKADVEKWGRELENAKFEYFRVHEPQSLNVPRFRVG